MDDFLSGIMEIPADRCVIVDAASMEEVRALAAGANVAHGKGNTEADYHNIIKRLMGFGDAYMANAFEPDISKIAEVTGAAKTAVGRGYNNYPKDAPTETLSYICKAQRDAAILNQHKKGLSTREIAKLFNIGEDVEAGRKTVAGIIKRYEEAEGGKNPESGKLPTPSVLPLANTEDRSETRADADELFDSLLEDYSDYISLAEVGKPRFTRLHDGHRAVSCR